MRLTDCPIVLMLGSLLLFSPSLKSEPPARPRPIIAWPAGPLEVRVVLDSPGDEALARSLEGASIAFGEPDLKAANRLISTAGKIGIAAANLSDGGRTLVLATDPHPREATYLLSSPNLEGSIAYTLRGVEVVIETKNSAWMGWWPELDLKANRSALIDSVSHRAGFDLLKEPGKLTMRSMVGLPPGKSIVKFLGSSPVSASVTAEGSTSIADGNFVEVGYESSGEAVDLTVTLATGVPARSTSLVVSYRSASNPSDIPVTASQLTLPWSPLPPSSPAVSETTFPDLSGGDPTLGEAVFRGAESKCASCHKLAGQGGEVGPALDAVAGRDRAWIYRSIAVPSAEINPEYVPYTVALKDGRIAAGIVRAQGSDSIRVLDAEGKPTIVLKSEIEELRPSGTSIMPVGLEGAIGPEKMRDLIAYLSVSKTPTGSKK